ncbi:MAG: hypothetical protein JSU70_18755 [Phycisphaerales bacterium]|nr:MAG: hypothetical protein JSU70_18755 [Phycisphaerales bacterium]
MRTMLMLLLLISLLALPTRLWANAWMLDAGEGFAEVYNKFYWATQDYDYRGNMTEKPNSGRYEEFRPELKVEYGLCDQLNLLFAIPYKWARWEDINGTLENNGAEFVGVGAKLRLSKDLGRSPAASLQVKFETPGGYNRDTPPSLGHGKSDLETRLMIGKVLDNRRVFGTPVRLYHVGGEIGYRTLNNKIPYFVEVGLRPAKSVLVKGMIDGVFATSDIDRPPADAELIQKKYEEYSKVMVEVLISPDRVFGVLRDAKGLSIGLGYGYTFYGKNTAVGSEITLKLFYRS